MPTILNLGHENRKELEKCVDLINKVKGGMILQKQDLELLKKIVNNSIVGVSKLLHFVNPNYYLIWDSRVARYFQIKSVNNIDNYLKYLDFCHNLSKDLLDKVYHNICEIEPSFKKATKLRTLEFIFFNLGKTK